MCTHPRMSCVARVSRVLKAVLLVKCSKEGTSSQQADAERLCGNSSAVAGRARLLNLHSSSHSPGHVLPRCLPPQTTRGRNTPQHHNTRGPMLTPHSRVAANINIRGYGPSLHVHSEGADLNEDAFEEARCAFAAFVHTPFLYQWSSLSMPFQRWSGYPAILLFASVLLLPLCHVPRRLLSHSTHQSSHACSGIRVYAFQGRG